MVICIVNLLDFPKIFLITKFIFIGASWEDSCLWCLVGEMVLEAIDDFESEPIMSER